MPLSLFSSCATSRSTVYKPKVAGNKVEVPLSLFETGNVQMVRPKGWFFDIAVMKGEDGSYSAMLLKCTHMDNDLIATGNGFRCNLHGSYFARDEKGKKGPAERPLQKYKTAVENNNLIITV